MTQKEVDARRELAERTTRLVVAMNRILLDASKEGIEPRIAEVSRCEDGQSRLTIDWFAIGE